MTTGAAATARAPMASSPLAMSDLAGEGPLGAHVSVIARTHAAPLLVEIDVRVPLQSEAHASSRPSGGATEQCPRERLSRSPASGRRLPPFTEGPYLIHWLARGVNERPGEPRSGTLFYHTSGWSLVEGPDVVVSGAEGKSIPGITQRAIFESTGQRGRPWHRWFSRT